MCFSLSGAVLKFLGGSLSSITPWEVWLELKEDKTSISQEYLLN